MKAWWYRLSEREQRLLLVTGSLLLFAGFWWGLWQPLQQDLAQAEAKLARAQTLHQQIQQQAQQVLELQAAAPATTTRFAGSLSQLASSTSKRYGIRISRLQPGSENALQIFMDDAEFNQLLAWLSYLRGRGITIDSIDLAATEQPGFVKLKRLVLRSNDT